MHQWKVILATVLIFGSGVGTGHLLSHRNATDQPAPESTNPANPATPNGKFSPANSKGFPQSPARPMMFRSHGYLDNHLKLTDEQKTQMLKIRKAGHDRVREFGKPFREQIITEDKRVREEIRALLTPEQARTFDRLPHFRINPEPGRPGGGRPLRPRPDLPHTNDPRPPRQKSLPEGPSATPPNPPKSTAPNRAAAA
jgi:Spy/CpxP family protein refolding chaperone